MKQPNPTSPKLDLVRKFADPEALFSKVFNDFQPLPFVTNFGFRVKRSTETLLPSPASPISPPSGPTTGSINGLQLKCEFAECLGISARALKTSIYLIRPEYRDALLKKIADNRSGKFGSRYDGNAQTAMDIRPRHGRSMLKLSRAPASVSSP